MPNRDKYLDYWREIPSYIQRCADTGKRSALGYTGNLDVVIDWNPVVFQQILDKHAAGAPSISEGDRIDNLQDLCRIVSYCMMQGLGGEYEITDAAVCRELESRFATAPSLGGTCAQGAAALAAVGMPVLMHLSDRSRTVCSFLSGEQIVGVRGDETVNMMELAVADTPYRHVILQYSKDDLFVVGGKEFRAPVSNRLILDYDLVHKTLDVEECFLRYCEQHADSLYSYNVSGFNAITSVELLRSKLVELKAHYARVKENNRDCVLYLESAHYMSNEARHTVFCALAPSIDILGMNEEELVDLAGQNGITVDKESLPSVLEGLDCLLSTYPVGGIVMHTKDYALYTGAGLPGADIERGLTLGNLLSGTRARTGRYGSLDDCRETIEQLTLSEAGLAFQQELVGMSPTRETLLVPSRYMEKPRYTIGLGDAFAAGMQIGFIR